MYDTNRDLIDALAAGPDALEGMLTGVDADLARRARGGDEGWSVVEVVCHLRDAEERAAERMRAIRDEDDPRIAGYDQDAWAMERDYARGPSCGARRVLAPPGRSRGSAAGAASRRVGARGHARGVGQDHDREPHHPHRHP